MAVNAVSNLTYSIVVILDFVRITAPSSVVSSNFALSGMPLSFVAAGGMVMALSLVRIKFIVWFLLIFLW